MPLTQQTIDELRRLEKEATPGEWSVSQEDGSGFDLAIYSSDTGFVVSNGLEGDGGVDTHKTADFICSLRNNAKALLDEIERLREENERLKAL